MTKINGMRWKLPVKGMLLLFAFCAVSCSKNKFVVLPTAHFNLANDKLADEQKVEILSFSGMPDLNNKAAYFIHMIVVDTESKDTFNLLTVSADEVIHKEVKEMHFMGENSSIYQALMTNLSNTETYIRPTEVKLDVNFLEDTRNHYPTVIGVLVTITKNYEN